MPDTTPNLVLPEIASAQAQKHVTHNEALRVLDALVHLAVLDRDLAAPPGSPAEGERWLVAAGASGSWSGKTDQIAAWQDGGWLFYPPSVGWLAYVVDEEALLAWSGSTWEPALDLLGGATELQNMALLGLGTAADGANPFSAKLNNALWVAKTEAEGGNGDLRYKLSKESAAKTLSLLFQDNFSGRAEIGLTGDNDFHFKVSDDGTIWRDAIVIDNSTGQVSFPQGGSSADLELTLAELSLGVADALNVAQFLGSSGNRFADSFDALTYVDVAGATNFDSGTAGLLKATASGGSVHPGSSATTSTTNGATMFAGSAPSVTNGDVIYSVGVHSTNALTMTVKVGLDNGGGTFDIVVSKSFSHPGGGWADCILDTPYEVPGSGTLRLGVYSPTSPNVSFNSTGTRYQKTGDITGTGQTGFSTATDGVPCLRYTETGTVNNFSVASITLTAAGAPDGAKLVARVKEVDSIALNTDLIASASRDGGTTWSAFTLTKKYTSNTISVYESAILDLSGQPSDTSMKWKFTTANNKMVEVHDVYFYWT